jgi:uncharacterized RDD family membrane protein YckC
LLFLYLSAVFYLQMDNQYYIEQNGEEQGPYSSKELIEMGLDLHTRLLSPTTNTWEDACDLPEFFAYFQSLGADFPTEDNLASFWWRLLAFVIDYLILSFILGIVFSILTANGLVYKIQSIDDALKLSSKDRLIIELVFYCTLIIYNAIGEASAFKGSIGKKVCKLVVVDGDGLGLTIGNAILRSLVKSLTFFLYGLGFLSIFWSQHRQALDDMAVRSYVVKKD